MRTRKHHLVKWEQGSWLPTLCAVALLTGAASACGGKDNSNAACQTGSVRCACYRNKTCDEGLTCASDLCVVFASAGGEANANGNGGSASQVSTNGGSTFASTTSNEEAAGGRAASNPIEGPNSSGASFGGSPLFGTSLGGVFSGGVAGTSSLTSTAPFDPVGDGSVRLLSSAQLKEFDGLACRTRTDDAVPNPTQLQLVVDVSSSMNTLSPGSTESLWVVTRDALVEAIVGVNGPGLGADTAVGLLFYPNMVNSFVSKTPVTVDACVNTQGATSMAALGNNGVTTQRSILRNALTTPILGRGTPTVDAYEYALSTATATAQTLALPGELNVLLVTDGQPTLDRGCYNSSGTLTNLPGDPVVDAVANAFAKSVRTFVVALPGTEIGKDWLSRAAERGGTAKSGCDAKSTSGPYCHADLTTAPDLSVALREALSAVAASLSPCQFRLPAGVPSDATANSMLGLMRLSNGSALLIGKATSSTCKNGYRMLDATHIELCADTCALVKNVLLVRKQLVFGCEMQSAGPG